MKSENLVQRARGALLGLEELGRRDGVAWLCDAAAGGGDAVRALGMRGGPVIVITRGVASPQSNGVWHEWAAMIGSHASHVLLFGASAERMAVEIQARGEGTVIVRCADLADAAQTAERVAGPGSMILFSPGCTRSALGSEDAELFRELVPVGLRTSTWAAA